MWIQTGIPNLPHSAIGRCMVDSNMRALIFPYLDTHGTADLVRLRIIWWWTRTADKPQADGQLGQWPCEERSDFARSCWRPTTNRSSFFRQIFFCVTWAILCKQGNSFFVDLPRFSFKRICPAPADAQLQNKLCRRIDTRSHTQTHTHTKTHCSSDPRPLTLHNFLPWRNGCH